MTLNSASPSRGGGIERHTQKAGRKQQTKINMHESKWQASDTSKAEYLGTLEVEDKHGEFHVFEVMVVPNDRYIFGGACNAGFLESGYMLLEEESGELENLHGELQAFYDDGEGYAPRLVHNHRM